MTHRKLLGEIMIEMGLASRDLVTECLNVQTEIHQKGLDPVPIGKLLLGTGRVTLDQLDKALKRQERYRLPN
jgi:hypothetical protein